MNDLLTMAEVARHFNVNHNQVWGLYARGTLPWPPKVGSNRMITRDQLPAIEEALRRAGCFFRRDLDK